ncbi:MAG: DNA pilot protein [Microvirus sp.]|nr:MAG: DNA pilot protein [Microvirus sp.]
MGVLDIVPFVGPALDAVSGVISANQARKAFKSRYQDTVADMKKAGLNPSLAYGQGGGNPQTVPLPDLGRSLEGAAQTSASAKSARASASQAKETAALTAAQRHLLEAQTDDLILNQKLRNQEIQTGMENTTARTTGENLRNQGTEIQNAILQIDQRLRQTEADYQSGTLQDRINLIKKQLERAGVDISSVQVQTALNRAAKPKAELLGNAASGATQVVNQLADTYYDNPGRDLLGSLQDWKNKNLFRKNHGWRKLK